MFMRLSVDGQFTLAGQRYFIILQIV